MTYRISARETEKLSFLCRLGFHKLLNPYLQDNYCFVFNCKRLGCTWKIAGEYYESCPCRICRRISELLR